MEFEYVLKGYLRNLTIEQVIQQQQEIKVRLSVGYNISEGTKKGNFLKLKNYTKLPFKDSRYVCIYEASNKQMYAICQHVNIFSKESKKRKNKSKRKMKD